jgi:farnesyl diphosphate synthase
MMKNKKILITLAIPRKGGILRPFDKQKLAQPKTILEYQNDINELISEAHRRQEFGNNNILADACYKALIGGKRIRAIMIMEIARLTCSEIDVYEMALFIEYIHAASLVIDDLPAFDNDMMRRGRPSIHAEFGQAIAQMCATALIATGLQNICRQIDWIKENSNNDSYGVNIMGIKLYSLISNALGVSGASGGQCLELSTESNISDQVAVMKTASLFELSICSGWLVAGGDMKKIKKMIKIGRHIGRAFQFADDLCDMEKDKVKPFDANYANIYGVNATKKEIYNNLTIAKKLLKSEKLWSKIWKDELFPLMMSAES